jgi:hypothetical protein
VSFCPTGPLPEPCLIEVQRFGLFCPHSDVKFATASDDKAISIWDFERGTEDLNLTGLASWCLRSRLLISCVLVFCLRINI